MDLFQAGQNPFLSGGLVLMLVGGALYYLKQLPGRIYNFLERFFILKMEVLDEDESYQWMQVWLADKLRRTLSVSVVTKRNRPDESGETEAEKDANRPTVYFVPAVGTYFFWYKRRFVTLSRDRQENAAGPSLLAGSGGGDAKSLLRNKESFTLRIFSRNRDLARQLIEECRDKALPEDGRMDIRIPTYGYWALGTRIKPRALDSVILDGNQAEELLIDMKEFLTGADWYQRVGVPYRRGYLLYGPPGNGKTSAVKALAGELGMSIYLLMLSDPDMNDNRINDLLAKVPDRNIVLLEDIDCAFAHRKRASGKEGGLTFSGLLNALDGVASPEGRIIVMTTNHIEKLDPALIRPGRADVKLSFGNATADQAGRLYQRFFPEHASLSHVFAGRIEDCKYSMATLQDYLMLHRNNPEEAVRQAEEIGRLQTSNVPLLPREEARPRPDRQQRNGQVIKTLSEPKA
ncbi:MAG TPA: AAA family ATPase [Gemmataceae bacterium]|nr:AAA family ATPase [Gemmataceae bacterium]